MISIVIPSYKHLSDCLQPCLESIKQHTDLSQIEVIVVLNGCGDDGSREYVESLGDPFRVVWLDEPSGYTHSTNVGIREAKGDYIVLLNNDVVILGREWIPLLLQPFQIDPEVGITGPLMLHCPDANEDFLVFFCVMIKRECLESIGGELDESFSPGYGEDCCAAIEARRKGWKVLQVPPSQAELTDKGCEDLPQWKRDKMWTNPFPIYHDGNKTFGDDHAAFDVILNRNKKILQERYGKVNTPTDHCEKHNEITLDGICISCERDNHGLELWRASVIDGWFGVDEMAQLTKWVRELPPYSIVVSIGEWHGRSGRAIADNLPNGCRMLAIDTWIGTSGEPEMHGSAHQDRGDHAFQWWWCNLNEHIFSGKVIPIRMHSENAAQTLRHLQDKGEIPKFDLIFIDADHSYEGFTTDVSKWASLMKEGALWCGHDYYPEGEEPYSWIGVRKGVQKYFPDAQKAATSLWYSRSQPILPKPTVIDTFPLNDELLLLEMRLNETDRVVDRWVIAEGTLTHAGKPKPLYFKTSIEREPERWAKFLPKITHIIVDDFPETDDPWVRERWQREATMRGLTECKDDDVILVGDVDEIPNAETVAAYRPEQGLCRLKQRLLYCYMNIENKEGWDWLRIAPYKIVRERTTCGIRYPPEILPIIEHGGWHFSFMGGPEAWVRKLDCTAHQEYNTPQYTNPQEMLSRVLAGKDVIKRDFLSYEFVEIDGTFPRFVRENLQRFIEAQFIMHVEAKSHVEKVRERFPEFFTGKKVLEVGSLDINGTPRRLFSGCDYTGLDLVEGYGVDQIGRAHEHTGKYDVVISTEMLEHDEHWRESLKQMFANLNPGGLMVITCAGPNRPEHGTKRTETYSSPATPDYYRNLSAEDFQSALPMDLWKDAELCYGRDGEDLYFYGIKPGKPISDQIREEWHAALSLPSLTVTAEVSTKDRETTTLPMCLAAILTQTHLPNKLVIYDDGEQKDLREISPFNQLFKLADDKGVKWEIFATPRKGQVTNHQHCLDTADTDLIWRCDDDEIPEPDCLEKLLMEMKDGVGAVAGLVHHPGNIPPRPSVVDGSLNDLSIGLNLQWCAWNNGSREVEHLYSTFLFRVNAGRKAGGYPKELSSIGHREETWFTIRLRQAGYKLVVTPFAKTWHLRQETGGIRSFSDGSLWEHDEQLFQAYLKALGHVSDSRLLIVDAGIGDHLALKGVWSDIRRRNPDKKYTLALCYPEVFDDVDDVTIISIADAKLIVGDKYDDHSLYAWMWKQNWKQSLPEAMMEFWG